MAKLKIGLFFGGRPTEHEVSVISALQAYKSLNKEKYEVVPVYVTKEGQFFSDPKLLELKNYRDIKGLLLSSVQNIPARIGAHGGLIQQGFFKKMKPLDLAFPLFHGSFGEDGCIQGLFEIYQIPYVGFNVTGSAIAMDKVQFKAIVKELGYPVANYTYFSRNAWIKDPKQILKQLTRESTGLSPVQDDTNGGLKFPMFFKPLDGCGVTRVDFFVDPKKEKFWVNEMNTPPGSLAFYLWEKSGIKYTELLDLLIGYALKREEDKKKTQYVFNSGLLQEMAK